MAAYSVADAAFRAIDAQHTGFNIWRIEKLEVVPVPRESYGKFFAGDSYIIFSCSESGETGGPQTKVRSAEGRRLEQHIHFWLGEDSSTDEATVAAYKTVELDDLLGGAPTQHREVQGHESKRFLAYFKNGLRVLQGGVASGLNHVVDDKRPKLYLVKGKRQPIVRQLPHVSWAEMNDGDTFVLDVRSHLFVWTGRNSNRLEKLQAAKLAQKLKEENGGGEVVVVEDGHENQLPKSEIDIFDQFLPLASKQVKAGTPDSDDKEDVRTRKEIKLYLCSDADGTLRVSEVKTGPLLQADLKSEDSFFVDNGNSGIWVWVGKKASNKERTEAMRNAQGFIKKKGYAAHTPVTRVVDGGEPVEFKSLFKNWKEKDQSAAIGGKKYSMSRGVAKVVQTKFDAKTLHSAPAVAAEMRMVDDGKGAKEVFRVDRFDLVPVPEADEGKFYSGDCYVVLYAYNDGSKDCYMIYYWLGAHSAQDEQGTAALKAVELDDRLGGQPVQVRVAQGKEPPHFLAIFQGRLAILQGGVASAFDGSGGRNVMLGSTYLLQVHGRAVYATKAVQVALAAASLNTNDCFVLVTPGETYVWLGKGSTGDEREMAKHIALQTNKDPEIVYEGQEKPAFWGFLGGKGAYMDERVLKDVGESRPPRLFHGSNASGIFRMEEILNFGQADLVTEDVMLLDVEDTLFVWLGHESNDSERRACIATAREYLDSDPSGRDKDLPIVIIKQGCEPPSFTGFFGAWDQQLFKNLVPVERSSGAGSSMTNGVNGVEAIAYSDASSDGSIRRLYDLKTLAVSEGLPPEVDPAHRELYLLDVEFERIFSMPKDKFQELPGWKQAAYKKNVGLF